MQSLWPNLACYLGNAIKTNGGSIQFVQANRLQNPAQLQTVYDTGENQPCGETKIYLYLVFDSDNR